MDTTPRLGIRFPEGTDDPDVPLRMSQMATDLDQLVEDYQGTLAGRALIPQKRGIHYRALDDYTGGSNGTLYRHDGTDWHPILDADHPRISAPGRIDIQQPGVVLGGDLKPTTVGLAGAQKTQIDPGTIWLLDAGGILTRHLLVAAWQSPAQAANGGGNPRIDSIVATPARFNDPPGLQLVQGNAVAGAQIATPGGAGYRAGAPGGAGGPALPAQGVVLRDIVVNAGAGGGAISSAVDRRPWAQGWKLSRDPGNGGNLATAGGNWQTLDPAFQVRMECSGKRIFSDFTGIATLNQIGTWGLIDFFVDGVEQNFQISSPGNNIDNPLHHQAWIDPAPGSHVFSIQFQTTNGGFPLTIERSGVKRPVWTLEESLKPTTVNG